MIKEKVCLTCGKILTNNQTSYCSVLCYNETRRGKTYEEIFGEEKAKRMKKLKRKRKPRITKKCKQCNKEFITISKEQIFCSRECFANWRSGKTIEEILGEEQGKQFRINTGNQTRGKTYEELYGLERVEEEKRKRGKVDEVQLTCKVCGKKYFVLPYIANDPHKKFCSSECFYKYRKGKQLKTELHDSGIDELVKILEGHGWKCIPIGKLRFPKPDVIAIKDNEIHAYEVNHLAYNYSHNIPKKGTSKYHKTKTTKYFDKIIWINMKDGKLLL